jgi:purine catabolism regulator
LHPGSKSVAAASIHLSRPAFYDRLARIERVVGGGLDDPDLRVSLHVALLADEMAGPAGTSRAPGSQAAGLR